MLLEMMAPCAAFTRRVAVASRLALAFAGGALLAVTALVPDAEAKTLRFAFQGELKSVDPYASMEASAWRWAARSMRGCPPRPRSQDRALPGDELGNARSAALALPSAQGRQIPRAARTSPPTTSSSRHSDRTRRAPTSRAACRADTKVVKVDDYTVDFILTQPDPLLIANGTPGTSSRRNGRKRMARPKPPPMNATTPALCRAARQRHRPVHPRQPRARREDRLEAQSRTGGTSPSTISTRWCSRPISNDATRVAALLSGDIDWMDPVPLHDQARVNANPGTRGPRRAGASHHLPRLRPDAAPSSAIRTSRARTRSRTCACARPSTRRSTRTRSTTKVMRGLATPARADDRAVAVFAVEGLQAPALRSAKPRRSCSPRPAIRTALRCRWIARTTATSMTRRSARRSSACWRASASRSI